MVKIKTIILAAGYAVRLYPLTEDKPKPLLEVAGASILDRLLEKIHEVKEIDEVFVVTNSKFIAAFEDWTKTASPKIKITVLNDGTTSNDDRLGAIGDIKFVVDQEKIDDDLLVIAGDNLFDFSLVDFVNFYKTKLTNIIAVYDITSFEEAKKFGVTAIDKNDKLIDFEEKPSHPKSTLISTACYLFPERKLSLINKYVAEGNKPDRSGDFIRWLMLNDIVHCFVSKDRWFDIGSFESLEEADSYYKSKHRNKNQNL